MIDEAIRSTVRRAGVLAALLVLFLGVEAWADGAVRGVVSDGDGAPLVGVNIEVDGADIGAVTDAEGGYELVVDEGVYTIRASLIGYATVSSDLSVRPGRTITADFVLTLEPIELSSTLISASAIGEDARRAPNRVNVISAAEIASTPAPQCPGSVAER